MGNCFDDRYNKKQPRSPQRVEAAEPQDNGPVPLIRDLGGEGNDNGDDKGGSDKTAAPPTSPNTLHRVGESCADSENDDENERCKRVGRSHGSALRNESADIR